MAELESSVSPQVKFIQECSLGFQTRNLDILAKALHEDCRYVVYPRSIGRPEQTKEEWLVEYAGIVSLWTSDPELTFRFIADTPGKVVLHTTNKVMTSIGVERNRESILTLHIVSDEDGNLRIKHAEEFTDSKAELDFVRAVAAAKAEEQ